MSHLSEFPWPRDLWTNGKVFEGLWWPMQSGKPSGKGLGGKWRWTTGVWWVYHWYVLMQDRHQLRTIGWWFEALFGKRKFIWGRFRETFGVSCFFHIFQVSFFSTTTDQLSARSSWDIDPWIAASHVITMACFPNSNVFWRAILAISAHNCPKPTTVYFLKLLGNAEEIYDQSHNHHVITLVL